MDNLGIFVNKCKQEILDLDNGITKGLNAKQSASLEYKKPQRELVADLRSIENIGEFESIIEAGDEWLIDWDYFGYEPIGIQEEIERKQELQREGLILDRLAGGGYYAY